MMVVAKLILLLCIVERLEVLVPPFWIVLMGLVSKTANERGNECSHGWVISLDSF